MSHTLQYVIVFILIAIAVVGAIILFIKSRRQGVSPGCAGCALSGSCNRKERKNTSKPDCHEDNKELGQ